MEPKFLLIAFGLMSLAHPICAEIFVVDDDGGAGVDFIDIQSAISASGPKDTVLVLPGFYSSFVLARGVDVRASVAGSVLLDGVVAISSVPEAEVAQVSGFTSFCNLWLDVSDCAGTVLLLDLSVCQFPKGHPVPILTIMNCADVRVHRCSISSATDRNTCDYDNGSDGVRVSSSRVEFVECSIAGGPGYDCCFGGRHAGNGITAGSEAFVHVARSSVTGGDGDGKGTGCSISGTGVVAQSGSEVVLSGDSLDVIQGGNAAPGVRVEVGGSVRYSGVSILAGGGFGSPIVNSGGTLIVPEELDPTLKVTGVIVPGGALSFVLRGIPGTLQTLLIGSAPTSAPGTGAPIEGLVLPMRMYDLGLAAPGGEACATIMIPATWPEGLPLIGQVELLDSQGAVLRTNSTVASEFGGIGDDCNANGISDECDLASGASLDCNGNGVLDQCDISLGVSLDCNSNGIPDECDLISGLSDDCNGNGVPDECDLSAGSADLDGNGIPDACETLNVTYCTGKVNSDGCAPLVSITGTPSLTGGVFAIDAFAVKPASNGFLFYGLGGAAAEPFMGGTLCVQPPTRRTPLQNSGGSFFCEGVLAFDFNGWIQGGNEPLIDAGSQINAQYWYRDDGDTLGVGLTDAAEFFVGP